MTGTVFDIQRFCVHDGPGIRTTVFMKGCPLRCGWCHNPEGLSGNPQVQFFESECIGCLRCAGERTLSNAAQCPSGALKIVGETYEIPRLLEETLADRDFYGKDGGVTFSGGECLMQPGFVAEMLKRLKEEGISTAVDTCGFVPWQSIEKTLHYCDTYLYDVKCADPVLHAQYTGQRNDLILENLRRLSEHGARIWIRVPVIPDFNDREEEMDDIARILEPLSAVEKVTLIPYHTLGKSKYATLGMTAKYSTTKTITQSMLDAFARIFQSRNITVE